MEAEELDGLGQLTAADEPTVAHIRAKRRAKASVQRQLQSLGAVAKAPHAAQHGSRR